VKKTTIIEDLYLQPSEFFDDQNNNHSSPFGEVIQLNGEWQIAEGTMESIPSEFRSKVIVPGLVSSSYPAFDSVGLPSNKREAFWYQRNFVLRSLKKRESVFLKIHKAKYGTKVWINGEATGSNMLNFSPTMLNITSHLKSKKGENEIVVRVGAHIDQAPDTVNTAGEVEKFKYIPGIYDRIELIIVPEVIIEDVQIAADPVSDTVKIGWVYHNLSVEKAKASFNINIYEYGTGNLISSRKSGESNLEPGKKRSFLDIFKLENLKPWSPEDPQLYILEVTDGKYSYHQRFGARTFKVDPKFTNKALLNDQVYFFRGTNVSLFRFFEDPLCHSQPWDKRWVRKLHKKIKSLGMNSYRISISALPSFWFEIADEEGIAIFTEFPMWYALKEGVSVADFEAERKHPQRKYGIYPEKLTTKRMVNEYSQWMKELWNHASVIAWDGQNETWTHATGTAINIVRNKDLSNRPWDNGWSPPAGPNDYREAHHYFARYQAGSEAKNAFSVNNKPFHLSDLRNKETIPFTLFLPYQYAYGEPLNPYTETPCILNEYGYLWLNRDGTPTTLTKPYYDAVLGSDATPDQRRYHYARMLASLTEYWRSTRTCFGVLHAFILGQSIPDGATSDNLVDVDNLEFDPYFENYVKDAFSPLGICIEYWEWPLSKGKNFDCPIVLTNDMDVRQTGLIKIVLSSEEKTLYEKSVAFEVEAFLQKRQFVRIELPKDPGKYRLVATIERQGFDDVSSLRNVHTK
jgi:beta-galactosidase/beta-glucuronidase